jgi:hypothetical protein
MVWEVESRGVRICFPKKIEAVASGCGTAPLAEVWEVLSRSRACGSFSNYTAHRLTQKVGVSKQAQTKRRQLPPKLGAQDREFWKLSGFPREYLSRIGDARRRTWLLLKGNTRPKTIPMQGPSECEAVARGWGAILGGSRRCTQTVACL